MKELLEQRLHALRSEYETGQQMLADLEARQATETLLRIAATV